MGSSLQQMLRSLCFQKEWNYAVFWKLRHRSRMLLTCEDAYFNGHRSSPSKNKCSFETTMKLDGEHHSHDPLGSAIAKLSYQVYSLGEGVVGQVAVSGKHRWIFAEHVNNSCSSFEFDGWRGQFSAGIQTIAVVAVGSLGVVQLGSLSRVAEDATLVAHVRRVFAGLKDLVASFTNFVQQDSLPSLPAGCMQYADKAVQTERPNIWPSAMKDAVTVTDGPPCTSELSNIHQEKALQGINGDRQTMLLMDGGYEAHECEPGCNVIYHKLANQVGKSVISDVLDEGGNCRFKGPCKGLEHGHSNIQQELCDGMEINSLDSYQEMLHVPEASGRTHLKDSDRKLETEASWSHFYNLNTPVRFSTGLELLEALGPAFVKTNSCCVSEADKTIAGKTNEMPEEISSSQLTVDSGPENLLEAVVANVCHKVDLGDEEAPSRSQQSLLTTDRTADPLTHANHLTNSVGFSINQPCFAGSDTRQSSSGVCRAFSSRGFSSTCLSTCSDQLERSVEPPKKGKKRAKPGESCRPRPRDRQLIQDRIKELRELIPNGSKCSIDSLLERTVKHMLFLQNVTKHADKLGICSKSKIQNGKAGMPGSSDYGQGSSWAVEVGGHLKVCSILVENINKQGLMLIEMLCEECSHFLEIAESIRNLGLTILKGVTEAHGENSWIWFVVEGQNNKQMQRMDILWSLVQIFQSS